MSLTLHHHTRLPRCLNGTILVTQIQFTPNKPQPLTGMEDPHKPSNSLLICPNKQCSQLRDQDLELHSRHQNRQFKRCCDHDSRAPAVICRSSRCIQICSFSKNSDSSRWFGTVYSNSTRKIEWQTTRVTMVTVFPVLLQARQ